MGWRKYLLPGEEVVWKGKSIQFLCFSKIPDWLPLLAVVLFTIQPYDAWRKGMLTRWDVLKVFLTALALLIPLHLLLNLIFILGMDRYVLTDRRFLIIGRKSRREIELSEIDSLWVGVPMSPIFRQMNESIAGINQRIEELAASPELTETERRELLELRGDVTIPDPHPRETKLTRMNGYLLFLKHPGGTEEIHVNRPDKLRERILEIKTK